MSRTFLCVYLVCVFVTASAAQQPCGGSLHACDRFGTTLFFADALPPIQVSPLPECLLPVNPGVSNRHTPRNRHLRTDFVIAPAQSN